MKPGVEAIGNRPILAIVVAAAALAALAAGALAMPPIEFAGSRPARASDACVVPLPDDAPIAGAKADSLIALDPLEEVEYRTRYDLFDVDLDGDGEPEQIAQAYRYAPAGFYTRAWWGVYSKGRLDQVLFWSRAEERSRISRMSPPESLRDGADSLGFFHSIPEFFPAVDVTPHDDITGDGRPETVVWMVGRTMNLPLVQGSVAPIVLSPSGDAIRPVYRGMVLMARYLAPVKGDTTRTEGVCAARAFRLHARAQKAGGPADLLLEPFRIEGEDAICAALRKDDRGALLRDPDEFFPPKTMDASATVPPDWILIPFEGKEYGGYRFVGAGGKTGGQGGGSR